MTHSGLLAMLLLAFAAPSLLVDHLASPAPLPNSSAPAPQMLLLDCSEETLQFIPDGDFGEGSEPNVEDDPGLSPQLIYFTNPPLVPGSYVLASNSEAWAATLDNWIVTGDNSASSDGYMMIVSSSNRNEPDTVWQQTFSLCPGRTFEFTMDAINLYNTQTAVPEPALELFINGQSLTDFGAIPQNAAWDTYIHEFTTPTGTTTFTLSLVNNTLGTGGNDFALDNFGLTTCAPSIQVTGNTGPVCPGDGVQLQAGLGSGFDDPVYQWQVSLNNGIFEDVGQPTTDPSFSVSAVPPAARYRVLAAPEADLLDPDACAVVSEPVAIQYTPIDQCFNIDLITNITDQLCGGKLGENLLENGGFGMGQDTLGPALEDGITTLIHNSVDSFPQRPRQYVIAGTLNADPCDGFFDEPCWTSFERDSIDSTGYRMVIDADAAPDIFFQGEVDSLCENTTYQLSVEVLNLSAEFFGPNNPDADSTVTLPNIDLVVAPVGTPLELLQALPATYNSGEIENDTSVTTVGFTFEMAPGESEILVAVRNAGGGGFGNDLAIDNVRVSVCGPQSRPTYTMTCPDPPPPLTLTAEILGDEMGTDPAIQWIQKLPDGSTEELANENGETLDLVVYNPGDTYAFYVAENEANLLNPNCRIESDPAVIDFFPIPVDSIQAAICIGETYTLNGNTYDETGVYTEVFEDASVDGCDSVVVLDLQVADPILVSISESICPGESVTVGDQEFTEEGTYEVTLQAQGGCDSIVTLNLFFQEVLFSAEEEICEGDSIEFNGVFYAETGIYRDTLPAQVGCDTILQLDLTVLEAPRREETVSLCPGDSYLGETYFRDTTLRDTVPNPSGCDSIIATVLDLGPLSGFAIEGSTILCGSGPITLDATAENATYLWSTGETTPTLTVSAPGTYAVEVVSGLCSARDTVEVTEGDMELTFNAVPPQCPDDATGFIEVARVNGGQPPYTYFLDGVEQNQSFFPNLTAGQYEIRVDGSGGCSAIDTVTLEPEEPFIITLEEQINLAPGDSVQLLPVVNRPVVGGNWSPGIGLSCTDCLNPVASPDISTTYTLTLVDDRGCQATAQILVRVSNQLPIYAPNAFSPNGDGQNDFFTLYSNEEVQQIDQLIVFDRWGNKVFERSPLAPNDETLGWDGTMNGQDSPVGVYVFFAEVTLADGATETLKGDVTLLR